MGYNPITTAGCVAIAAAINECDSCALKKLDLQVIIIIIIIIIVVTTTTTTIFF